MRWAINNKIAAGFVTTLVVLTINAGITYRNILKVINSNDWVNHSNQVLTALEGTLLTIDNAETGERGYLITGQADYLALYGSALAQINQYVQRVKQLTADNPHQQQRIAQLQQKITRKLSHLNYSIVLRRQQGFTAAQHFMLSGQGKQEMNQIRALVGQVETEERSLLQKRVKEAKVSTQETILTFSIASAVSLVLLGLVFYLVRRDITERAIAENTLRASEFRFRRLFESNIIGMFFAEFGGNIIDANDAFLQSVGYTRDDLLTGKVNWRQMTPLEYRDQDEEIIAQVRETGVYPPCEKEYIRKDGTRVPVLLGVALLADSNKDECICFALDLTKQKLAEARIRQLNETLEQRVQQRTAQLEESNQEMEAFSYSVSHDLRAPLRSMQGFSQALLEDYSEQLDDLGKEYARRIIAAANRMENLIQDLLAYSRLSRAEIQLQPVNLTAVVQRAVNQLESEIKQQQALIQVAPDLPQVRGHYSTLVQIVTNLISNAIKFVESGVIPQVQVWAKIQGRHGVVLYVKDNGIGIAPEHQQRIFLVFERLHGIESYPGTGIGLAIVQKGVERLGGRVGVKSQLGEGSCFWVYLQKV